MGDAMQLDFETIFEAAVKLPESERLNLVSRLMDTMPESVGGSSLDDPDLPAELRRRSADPDGAISWSKLQDQF